MREGEPGRGPGKLRRVVSLPALTLYGLGNIVGAGIYVLLGKVAGEAGMHTALAFLLAGGVAGLSALAYAELAARMPSSAAEAAYLQRAFGWRPLSLIVGALIALAGVVSSAALARGFAGYLAVLVEIPTAASYSVLVVLLGALAIWGIGQSMRAAALLTLIEVAGLVLVIWYVRGGFTEAVGEWRTTLFPIGWAAWQGVLFGTFLAFYAFIGFEDMVKVAEEVKRPGRNLPLAILLALAGATALYVVLAVAVVSQVTPARLAQSEAPLSMIYFEVTGQSPIVITVIGVIAAINGVLAQIIMSSRMLYGMSQEGWLPPVLGRVHPRTRTPVPATLVTCGAILGFALVLPVETLAGVTSFLILAVFALINLALWWLKAEPATHTGFVRLPRWLPAVGFVVTLVMLVVGLGFFVGG